MASRFVTPQIVRLPLSDGDWIDIKRELNVGEQRRVFAKMARDLTPGESIKLNPDQIGRAKIVEALIAWSFVDQMGRPVPISEAAIDNLTVESYREMREAIDAHDERMDADRVKEKNDRDGAIASTAISPSAA